MQTRDLESRLTGKAIERDSVRIAHELLADVGDLSDEIRRPSFWPLVVRVVRACAEPSLAHQIVGRGDPLLEARRSLQQGAALLVDCAMVEAGLSPIRRAYPSNLLINALQGSPQCDGLRGDQTLRGGHDFSELTEQESPGVAQCEGSDDDRLRRCSAVTLTARGVQRHWPGHLAGAIVVIGNAPTALQRLVDGLIHDSWDRPSVIFAAPVGFVGAVEAKEALLDDRIDTPLATISGVRGGSAVACAMLNAVLDVSGDSLSDGVNTYRMPVQTSSDTHISDRPDQKAEPIYPNLARSSVAWLTVIGCGISGSDEEASRSQSNECDDNDGDLAGERYMDHDLSRDPDEQQGSIAQIHLSQRAVDALRSAELVLGAPRSLDLVRRYVGSRAQLIPWPDPFMKIRSILQSRRGKNTVVLATGEPLWFGFGATVARWFRSEEFTIIPSLGSFSVAAARMAWPIHEIHCLSIHGRPLNALRQYVRPSARWLVLLGQATQIDGVARLLCDHGACDARLTALMNLDTSVEARDFGNAQCPPRLSDRMSGHESDGDRIILAVECPSNISAPVWPTSDHALVHDGQLTKHPIRAVTLMHLSVARTGVLWDVGSGCGGVTVDWGRFGGRVFSLEPDPVRQTLLAQNVADWGIERRVTLVRGQAPEAFFRSPLDNPETFPHAVFIGGGGLTEKTVSTLMQRLRCSGVIVANVVTPASQRLALDWQARLGGVIHRTASAVMDDPRGPWEPLREVWHWVWTKS